MNTHKAFVTNVKHMDFDTFYEHLPEAFLCRYRLCKVKETINITSEDYHIWSIPWEAISHIEEFDNTFTIRHDHGFISFMPFNRVMTSVFHPLKWVK